MSKGNYLKKNNLIVSTIGMIHVEKSSHYIRTQFGHIRTHFVECTKIDIASKVSIMITPNTGDTGY